MNKIICMLALCLFTRSLTSLEPPKDIEARMTTEELELSGLQRLTPKEKKYLNEWLSKNARPYHCGVPIAQKTDQLKWVYETRTISWDSDKKIHYDLSISTIFQNEADYLEEWIEYHKLLGVQHFVLYNHLSTDNYLEALEPYLANGEVELIEWTVREYPHCQLTAYSDAIRRTKGKTRWLAFIDVDEFLVPVQKDNMIDFLADYEKYAEVFVNWQLFGTSNIFSLPKDALITEHMTYKFPKDFKDPNWNSNQFVKAIIKPDLVEENCWSSHCYNLKPGYTAVDPRKRVMKPWTTNADVPIDQIRLNHYWFRTIDYFYKNKVARRTDAGYKYSQEHIAFLLKQGHAEQDLTIARFLPKLRERIKQNRAKTDNRGQQ